MWISMPAISLRKDENKLPQKSICSDRVCLRKQFLGRKFPAETWPAVFRNQTWHTSLNQGLPEELFYPHVLAICLAVTRAMHSSHQTKPLSVLTGLMGTRCSWVSLDLSHTGTAGSALIRHKQVSSSLQQPFVFWPTPTLRHLKTFNWLLHFLWSQEGGGVHVIMSLLKVSEL